MGTIITISFLVSVSCVMNWRNETRFATGKENAMN